MHHGQPVFAQPPAFADQPREHQHDGRKQHRRAGDRGEPVILRIDVERVDQRHRGADERRTEAVRRHAVRLPEHLLPHRYVRGVGGARDGQHRKEEPPGIGRVGGLARGGEDRAERDRDANREHGERDHARVAAQADALEPPRQHRCQPARGGDRNGAARDEREGVVLAARIDRVHDGRERAGHRHQRPGDARPVPPHERIDPLERQHERECRDEEPPCLRLVRVHVLCGGLDHAQRDQRSYAHRKQRRTVYELRGLVRQPSRDALVVDRHEHQAEQQRHRGHRDDVPLHRPVDREDGRRAQADEPGERAEAVVLPARGQHRHRGVEREHRERGRQVPARPRRSFVDDVPNQQHGEHGGRERDSVRLRRPYRTDPRAERRVARNLRQHHRECNGREDHGRPFDRHVADDAGGGHAADQRGAGAKGVHAPQSGISDREIEAGCGERPPKPQRLAAQVLAAENRPRGDKIHRHEHRADREKDAPGCGDPRHAHASHARGEERECIYGEQRHLQPTAHGLTGVSDEDQRRHDGQEGAREQEQVGLLFREPAPVDGLARRPRRKHPLPLAPWLALRLGGPARRHLRRRRRWWRRRQFFRRSGAQEPPQSLLVMRLQQEALATAHDVRDGRLTQLVDHERDVRRLHLAW